MRRRLYRWMTPGIVFVIAVATACSDSGDSGTTDAPTTTAAPTTAAATAPPATTAAPVTTTSAQPGSDIRYGGEVIVADAGEPPTLNYFVPGGEVGTVFLIGQSYWAGVHDIDGFTLDRVPELVTELPTVGNGGVVVNDDGSMTVNYQIRDEAIWSDGTPISGADFQFTLDTIMNPDLPVARTTYEKIQFNPTL